MHTLHSSTDTTDAQTSTHVWNGQKTKSESDRLNDSADSKTSLSCYQAHGIERTETVHANMKAASEEVLVNAARAGNPAAFEELFHRFAARIYGVARALIRNNEEAEDIVQDSFLKAFRNLDRFRGDSRFSTWLFRIAVNEALMMRRRRSPLVSLDTCCTNEGFEVYSEITSREKNPEEHLATQELSVARTLAMQKLKPALRIVFQLRNVEQLSTGETAQVLGLSVAAVKTRLLRARMMLRDSLRPHLKRCRARPGWTERGAIMVQSPRRDCRPADPESVRCHPANWRLA